jgi:hypothetical protein
MERGRIAEFDSPYNLLQDPKSKFYAVSLACAAQLDLFDVGRLGDVEQNSPLHSYVRRLVEPNLGRWFKRPLRHISGEIRGTSRLAKSEEQRSPQ